MWTIYDTIVSFPDLMQKPNRQGNGCVWQSKLPGSAGSLAHNIFRRFLIAAGTFEEQFIGLKDAVGQ